MITRKIKENWPDAIPSFRRNSDENSKLDKFVQSLNTAKYTLPECGLGPSAIRNIVMTHMSERRRQQRLSDIYEATGNTTTESEMESESSDESSSANSPPNSHAEYFHNGMFLAQS